MLRGCGLLLAAALSPPAAAAPPAAIAPAPYDAPPASPARFDVSVDFSAAQQILTDLSRKSLKPGDAANLLALPAVAAQVKASGAGTQQWIADFANAFAQESSPGTFDLRSVRMARSAWEARLPVLAAQSDGIARSAQRRAAALLPADARAGASVRLLATFGLPGLDDHLLGRDGGRVTLIVDLARLPGGTDADIASSADALSRLAAQAGFSAAWDAYRSRSAAWAAPPALGPMSPLAASAAAGAPVGLYGFDSGFFPLATWLSDPMTRCLDAFNNEARVLLDPRTDLATRAQILAGAGRGSLQADAAAAAGPFLADAIFQNLGQKALLDALAGGPRAFLQAYEAAERKSRKLPPFLPPVREALEHSARNAR